MLLCCQSHLGCPSMSARQHHHLPPATQQCTHYFPVTTNEHIFHIMFWLVNCSINFDQSPHLLTQTTTPVALWQFLWRFWVTKIRFILCIKVNKQASTRISKEQLKREVGWGFTLRLGATARKKRLQRLSEQLYDKFNWLPEVQVFSKPMATLLNIKSRWIVQNISEIVSHIRSGINTPGPRQ